MPPVFFGLDRILDAHLHRPCRVEVSSFDIRYYFITEGFLLRLFEFNGNDEKIRHMRADRVRSLMVIKNVKLQQSESGILHETHLD